MSDPDHENDDANETESEESEDSETEEVEVEVEAERIVAREDGADVLRRLANGVADGSVTLGSDEGDEAITATVPDRIELEIEYEAGDEEAELEAELEWPMRDGEAVSAEESEGEDEDEDEAESEDEAEAEEPDAEEATDEAEEPEDDVPVADLVGGDAAGSNARFELYRDRADEWRWRLVHDNGNIIADSGEGYARKAAARNGLESVVRNAPGAEVVEETD